MKDIKNEINKVLYVKLMLEDADKAYNNKEISEKEYNEILKVILDLQEKIIKDYEDNKKN